jgi:hypothetical protein
MSHPHKFTPAEDAMIRRAYGNVPIMKIARQLHCGSDAIDKRALFLGLPPRGWREHSLRTGEPIVPKVFRTSPAAPPRPPRYDHTYFTGSSFIAPSSLARLMAGR